MWVLSKAKPYHYTFLTKHLASRLNFSMLLAKYKRSILCFSEEHCRNIFFLGKNGIKEESLTCALFIRLDKGHAVLIFYLTVENIIMSGNKIHVALLRVFG